MNGAIKKGIVYSLDEFAQNSTLHGLKYIVDRRLSTAEKLFWLIVVIAKVTVCGLLIHNTWLSWQNNIIITINNKPVPVSSVYYPSLTICPQNKIKNNTFNYRSEIIYLVNNAMNLNEVSYTERRRKVADIGLVCDNNILRIQNHTVNIDNIIRVALDYEDIFLNCKWNVMNIPCQSLFKKVLTHKGVCFTMNKFDADEIMRPENDFHLFVSPKNYRGNLSTSYPIRGSANNTVAEFVIILKELNKKVNSSCTREDTGFLAYLQDPADMPHVLGHPYTVRADQTVYFGIKFDSVMTSQNLQSYSINARQCYFPDEHYLQFFRRYTENNCKIECLANYTKQVCNCVPFYMPHDNKTRICSGRLMLCVIVANHLYNNYSSLNLINMDFLAKKNLINIAKPKACDCLPTCDAVNYDADISKSNSDLGEYVCEIWRICNDNMLYSKIIWTFKRRNFSGMTRSNMYGLSDFIAKCGGLLGLFLGFSLHTITEIVYYTTLRLYFIMRNKCRSRENLNSSVPESAPSVKF